LCGIAGIFYEKGGEQSDIRRSIERMTDAIKHRGPDDSGYFYGNCVALGHRRLSIIDLSGGHQPIYNEDKSNVIVFNGEIYNYLELKKELESAGHRFTSNSDTETILHAYEQWGGNCVARLRGMFAFAIWDETKRSLFLARDRFGKKPLYYAQFDGKFLFASEMKSILSDPSFQRRVDLQSLATYFLFAYTCAPRTIYEGIFKLPAAHTLVFQGGKATIKKYWDLRFVPDRKKKESDFILEAVELLRDSVKIRLMSEVPLGAFLSGGIDSGMVVALMTEQMGEPVKTFTIGFGGTTGGYEDERKYARMVAERYGTVHKEHEVTPRLEGLLEEIVEGFDEPFADDSSIPCYYVCKMARENVTVALSGLGGDEAFAGYERYLGFMMAQYYKKIPSFMRGLLIRPCVEMLPEGLSGGKWVNRIKRFARSDVTSDGSIYVDFLAKVPPKYQEGFFHSSISGSDNWFQLAQQNFIDIFNGADAEDPLNRVFYTDIKTYLTDDILTVTDRMSMWHSLEVRVPFLDHKFFEWSATIPPELKMKWFRKKYILKVAARNHLPEPILNLKKQGFVGPMATWLRTDLKMLVHERLSGRNLAKHNLLNHEVVRSVIEDHEMGRERNDTLLWALLIFQVWHEKYMM
jgi:asparagine synthase (glutamine-hydrolysing)